MAEARFPIAIFLSGRGSNFEAIVQAIKANRWPIDVVAVLSDKKSAPGLARAKEFGLNTLYVPRKAAEQTNEEFNQALIAAISPFKPELIVLAGFMCVLSASFIRRFANQIINIHPSLLPAFRGLHAQRQALEAGVRFAGCTVHYVAEEIDAGPIVSQAVVPVFQNDSLDALEQRILKQEHRIYPASIRAIASGEVKIELKSAGQHKVSWTKTELNTAAAFMRSAE